MDNIRFFYRNGIHCLIAQDERSEGWLGFIGANDKHPLHTVRFFKTKHIALYKYNSVNLITENRVWRNLNWLGFDDHLYSKEKTLEALKKIADEVGVPNEDGWSDIFDLVDF